MCPVMLLVAWALTLGAHGADAQARIHYVYDDLGRLVGVVDQAGNAAVYTYDAVGNILKIERFDSAGIPGAVAITLVSPNVGQAGTVVQMFGKGFGAIASQNTVAFSGVAATVTAAAPNRLVTSVPSGASSGFITVTAPLGSATSATRFRVPGQISISPPGAVALINSTHQFVAVEAGNPELVVTWSVNGIVGGNATVGTISGAGLYTAPATAPSPPVVTLRAADSTEPTLSASVQIFVSLPPPVFLTARGLSVKVAPPPAGPASAVSNAAPVAVQIAASPVSPQPATTSAPPVGVQIAAPSGAAPPQSASAAPVSLQIAPPLASPQPRTTGALSVSVQVATGPAAASETTAASPVAVTLGPNVTAVSPASASAGASGVTLTVTGAGLTGATTLTFLRNNAADSAITVTNLSVNANGTQATAQISIAAGAASGGRVVTIATPGGTSTAASTGANIFTVQ